LNPYNDGVNVENSPRKSSGDLRAMYPRFKEKVRFFLSRPRGSCSGCGERRGNYGAPEETAVFQGCGGAGQFDIFGGGIGWKKSELR